MNLLRNSIGDLGPTVECERKFLVDLETARDHAADLKPHMIQQIYLARTGDWAVRARRTEVDDKISYMLTMKRKLGHGVAIEIEEPAQPATFRQFFLTSGTILKKSRYKMPLRCGHVLELDIFENNTFPDFAMAEVELEQIEDRVALPEWIGDEVTGQTEYDNESLFERERRDIVARIRSHARLPKLAPAEKQSAD